VHKSVLSAAKLLTSWTIALRFYGGFGQLLTLSENLLNSMVASEVQTEIWNAIAWGSAVL